MAVLSTTLGCCSVAVMRAPDADAHPDAASATDSTSAMILRILFLLEVESESGAEEDLIDPVPEEQPHVAGEERAARDVGLEAHLADAARDEVVLRAFRARRQDLARHARRVVEDDDGLIALRCRLTYELESGADVRMEPLIAEELVL